MIDNNKSGQDTQIIIKSDGDNVIYKVEGKRDEILNMLISLFDNDEEDRDNFKNLIEEAIDIVKLQKKIENKREFMLNNNKSKEGMLN